MASIARANHSIPRAYLRGWSNGSSDVWAYRLLVPSERYPEWEHKSIATLTKYNDLYTSIQRGVESDVFERWLHEEVENPVSESLEKVRRDEQLNASDWRALTRYAAALDLRTPAGYQEMTSRQQTYIPEVLSATLANAKRELTRAARKGTNLRELQNKRSRNELQFSGKNRLPFPLRVQTSSVSDSDVVELRVEVTIGRELWLHSVQQAVEVTSQVLLKHRWQIIRPPVGWGWFTSDHPVVRLNWYAPGSYDFGGGWDRKGSEILLPLSPTHLMYTLIGGENHPTQVAPHEIASAFQRFIAERAHRWIIATRAVKRALWMRPRVIDREMFAHETTIWQAWHTAQRATAEK